MRNHYLPAFYLRSWTGSDGRVQCFRWANGRFASSRRSPDYTGYESDLYALEDVPNEQMHRLEERYTKPGDTAAALIHSKLLDGELKLSEQETADWAWFVLSLPARHPAIVQWLRQWPNELRQRIDEDQEIISSLSETSIGTMPSEFIEKLPSGQDANSGFKLLPEIISKCHDSILRMIWVVKRFTGASVELLTSDRPCIVVERIGQDNCVTALPLSPRLAFFAFGSDRIAQRLDRVPSTQLAKRLNDSVVRQAQARVYATGAIPRRFIERRLARSS